MYLSQKMKPSLAACEKTNVGQSSAKCSAFKCSSLRCWLLFWASLRLAISLIWTGVLVIMTYQTIVYYQYNAKATYITETPGVLAFGVGSVVLQLVEFGMLFTFIVAGITKNARLYRVYYRYCILTLMIYMIAVILTLALDNEYSHFFGEIYLTYHINDLPIFNDDGFAFGLAAIVDICFELLLIQLLKRLINKYSHVENNASCTDV